MPKKSPLLAFLLSVVPGLGQIYAGARRRGAALLIGLPLQALLFWLVGFARLIGWLIPIWLWNLFDAARVARGREGPAGWPILLLVVLNFIVGWQITQINLGALAQGLPNMRPIIVGLFEPDLFEPQVELQRATAHVQILGSLSPPPASRAPGSPARGGEPEAPKPGEPSLIVAPAVVRPSQTVRVTGSGFASEAPGRLVLVASGQQILARFTTDAQGGFAVSAEIPKRDPDRYLVDALVERPMGGWRASDTLQTAARKMAETIFLALMGTLLSLVVTIPLSFFGAKNLMSGSVPGLAAYGATRTVMNLLRSVEVLIIALMMVRAVGIGPFAGVLALAIHGVGALGKLYSEAIESIDPGPIEAITATGASRFQVVMFGVVPQVAPQFVAFTIYRWDINVRMATVLGLVGGGGIGFLLKDYMDLLRWPQAGAAILLIAATVIAMDYASALIRERLQ
jgi:phosphonate transport system permease protein